MLEKEIEFYFDKLWPICRSITGDGLRESFKIMQELIPLKLKEVPTGTKVFDWEIPMEWNIKDAYIITPDGRKICNFKINNLHVVNYSIPVNDQFNFDQLKSHLHTLPGMPEAIPYVTSYYNENWGFCLSHSEFESLPKSGNYKVVIDSSLSKGSLTYGDLVLKGETDEEILFSSYLCHPSMANNELSGPLCLAMLYQRLIELPKRKYTYRFLIAPETIGVIAYLSQHGLHMKKKTVAGYVLTCCGDKGNFVFKMSKHENSLAERAAFHVLKNQDIAFQSIPFSVGGSDERQYCSPGFNMPVCSLTRSMYQRYKEYHTSLDNKEFICFSSMIRTVEIYFKIVRVIEMNSKPIGTVQYCEPRLVKRGMSLNLAKADSDRTYIHRLLHLLSFADGKMDLIDIAEKRGEMIFDYNDLLIICRERGLLK